MGHQVCWWGLGILIYHRRLDYSVAISGFCAHYFLRTIFSVPLSLPWQDGVRFFCLTILSNLAIDLFGTLVALACLRENCDCQWHFHGSHYRRAWLKLRACISGGRGYDKIGIRQYTRGKRKEKPKKKSIKKNPLTWLAEWLAQIHTCMAVGTLHSSCSAALCHFGHRVRSLE